MDPIDFHSMEGRKKTMEVNGVHQLFGYQQNIILKTFFLC